MLVLAGAMSLKTVVAAQNSGAVMNGERFGASSAATWSEWFSAGSAAAWLNGSAPVPPPPSAQ